MTVTPKISISDGNLVVHGKTILSGVPDNILLTPGTGEGIVTGAFIGATASNSKSLHVFPMGVLEDLRFLCCFRFKLWWMTHRVGTWGRDVPLETQFMLIESKDSKDHQENSPTVYTVLLPLLEGQFRAVLQGNDKNEIEICLESGDPAVETNHGLHLVYMHAGTNPFEVINQAVKAVEKHMQTFHHREKKRLPSFLDWFGWCTWDAFYTDVTAEGVEEGLRSLSEGGTRPRFLIIDDGWQQIESKPKDADCVVQEGAQFATRLTGIKENTKFQRNGQSDDTISGLKHVVDEAKQRHNVKYVYVWHALAGYWGGVKPAASGMEHYDTALAYPVQSPGVLGNQPDIVMDSLSVHGLGLVHPKKVFDFYNELHAYLAACGVDGVKVDVQNVIETLGSGHGGRVSLTRSYHQALEASIARNFPDNGCIACMCHNTDGLYSAKQTAVVRASDDFYPHDPASHTIHISSVAYNTLFLGEFMQPDWDMFHSLHPAAEYHAAARAISGGPIYVSDKPGRHNFDLLKRLVLPDGSVLRAQLPGRPTVDSLFVDPARDGTSLLKIWNLNKCSGVVGVFTCQGAGWCKIQKKTRIHCASPGTLTGSVCASDVDLIAQVAGADWHGDTIVYGYRSGIFMTMLDDPFDYQSMRSAQLMEHEAEVAAGNADTGPMPEHVPPPPDPKRKKQKQKQKHNKSKDKSRKRHDGPAHADQDLPRTQRLRQSTLDASLVPPPTNTVGSSQSFGRDIFSRGFNPVTALNAVTSSARKEVIVAAGPAKGLEDVAEMQAKSWAIIQHWLVEQSKVPSQVEELEKMKKEVADSAEALKKALEVNCELTTEMVNFKDRVKELEGKEVVLITKAKKAESSAAVLQLEVEKLTKALADTKSSLDAEKIAKEKANKLVDLAKAAIFREHRTGFDKGIRQAKFFGLTDIARFDVDKDVWQGALRPLTEIPRGAFDVPAPAPARTPTRTPAPDPAPAPAPSASTYSGLPSTPTATGATADASEETNEVDQEDEEEHTMEDGA